MQTKGWKSSEAIGGAVATLMASGYGLTSASEMVQAASVLGICFVWGKYAESRGRRKGVINGS